MQRAESRSCSRCVVVYLLASMKLFAVIPLDIVAAHFSLCIHFLSGLFSFNRSHHWIGMKQPKTTARLMCTCDTCAHPYIGIILLHCSSVAACGGYARSSDLVCCCECARIRYILYCTYFATTATAVVVLQLLAKSAASASFTRYTAV